jgi:hypothetical protein
MPDRIQDYVDRARRYHNIDGMGEIQCGVMALWSVLLVNVLQAIPKESFWRSAYAAPLLWAPFLAALTLGGRAVKRRITYPRTGYVAPRRARTAAPAMAVALVAAAGFAVAVRYGGNAALFGMGAVLTACYAYGVARVDGRKWYVVLVLALGSVAISLAAPRDLLADAVVGEQHDLYPSAQKRWHDLAL